MKTYSKIISIALPLFVWILATLSMGGVAHWYEKTHLIWISVTALILYFFYIQKHIPHSDHERFPNEKIVKLIFFFILSIALFQLVPLPEKLLHFISPLAWSLNIEPLQRLSISFSSWGYPISLDPASTLQFVSNALGWILLFVVFLEIFRSHDVRRYFAYGIICFSAFISILGTSHRFTFSQTILWLVPKIGPIFGPYVNANHAGALLSIGCVMSFGLIYRYRDNIQQIFFSILCGFCALGIFHTGSRSAILATGVAMLIQVRWKMKNSKRDLAIKKFLLPALSFAIFLAFLWQAPSISRLTLTPKALMTGRELRPDIWKDAIHFFQDSPFFGIGMGAFSRVSPIAVGDRYFLHPEHVENEYLEFLCCGGFLAFLAGIILLFFLFKKLFQIFSSIDVSTTTRAYGLGAVVFLIQSFFVFHAPLPAHQILSAIIFAGVFSSHRFSIFSYQNNRRIFFGLLSISFLLGFGFLFHFQNTSESPLTLPASLSSEESRAESLLKAADIETAATEKIRTDPLNARAWYELSIANALTQNATGAKNAYQQAKKLDPYHSHHRILVATALAESKAYAEALFITEELLNNASPLSPTLLSQLHLNAARYQFFLGNLPGAETHLLKAQDLDSNNWRVSLLEAFLHPKGMLEFARSWQQVSSDPKKSVAWDYAIIDLIKNSKSSIDVMNLIQTVAPLRKDIGIFLERFSSFLPKEKLPIIISLDKNIPSPRLKVMPEHVQENTSWIKSLDPYQVPEEFEVKAKSKSADFDIYYLPTQILLAPQSLSFRMHVRSTRTLTTQMVLIINGKPLISREKPTKISSNEWLFHWNNLGKALPTLEKNYYEISGIGFTPLERDGRYGIGPIEVLLETIR